MITRKQFPKAVKRGFLMGAVLLALLAKSGPDAPAQNVSITLSPPVIVAPVVVPDSYLYYPNYGVYYNQHNRRYYYLNGTVWVNRPQPLGVSVLTLQASPYVTMNWHDSPEHHHAEMQRQYPRNWRPDPGHQDQHDGRKDFGHDDNR